MNQECQCERCQADLRDWLDDRNHLESVIASDPERDPATKPTTDAEYRQHLNETMPIVSRYPRTPHPTWGGTVLTENYVRMISRFSISTSDV